MVTMGVSISPSACHGALSFWFPVDQWFSDSKVVGQVGAGGREPGRGSLRKLQHLLDENMRALGAMRTTDAMEPVSGQVE